MTAYHSLRLFQLVSKYIHNQDDSREFVTEIEEVVRHQLQMETTTLATKSELFQVKDELKRDIDDLKRDINHMEVCVEAGFKDQLKWIILLMLGFSSLIITVVKFL